MNKIAQKKNISSMQVLKTFQLMLKEDLSMQELLDRLNSNEPDIIYNNSVVSKYINTCRFCGIEIPKIHNKYCITHIPFGLKFTSSEIDILENLKKYISDNMSKKSIEIFTNFMAKLNRFSDKKLTPIKSNNYQDVFEQFERAVKEKRKIKLLFKNRDIQECTPIRIIEEDGKVFLKIYSNKYKIIDITRLSGIETLHEVFLPVKDEAYEVIYKLTPPMSKRYELRVNETKLMEEADGSVVIVNKDENKEHLIARLLRYDIYCEVLKPSVLREEMKQIILDTLKNYEE